MTMLVLKLLHQPELSMEVFLPCISIHMQPLFKILLLLYLVYVNKPASYKIKLLMAMGHHGLAMVKRKYIY